MKGSKEGALERPKGDDFLKNLLSKPGGEEETSFPSYRKRCKGALGWGESLKKEGRAS